MSLADEPQSDGSVKRVWTLHGHADAVSGGDADANIYVADTYTAALRPPASAPDATPAPTPTAAHLFLHVDLSGELALGASGFAEYESDARFWTVLPDGSFGLPDRSLEEFLPAGYWPSCGRPHCEVPLDAVDFMGPGRSDPAYWVAPNRWIAREDYEQIRLQLPAREDPPAIDISGTWKKDGTVQLGSMDEYDRATLSTIRRGEPGGFQVEMVDDSGNVLYSTGPLETRFKVDVDVVDEKGPHPSEPLDTDVALIGMTLPYPLATASVRFEAGGQVVLSVDPLSRTLRDSIASIPDRGYAKNPKERRKALLDKVDALERMIGQKAFRGALRSLDGDIRGKVRDWIVDYTGQPDELSKQKVLDQVDRVAARLQYRLDHGP